MWKKRNSDVTDIVSYFERKHHQPIQNFLARKTGYGVVNADKVAEKIREGIKAGKLFFIVGDYDVDGITSTAIMKVALERAGAKVTYRIPRRFSEGYGISLKIAEEVPQGSVVITVDNGIMAHEVIDALHKKQCSVLLTDHHQPKREKDGSMVLPDADVICNPQVYGHPLFNGYCGAGVALYIARELIPETDVVFPLLEAYAAIGTICDQMDLVEDNRNLVIKGLEVLNRKRGILTRGLKALEDLAGYNQGNIKSSDIAFMLGPMLNAPGRLHDDGAQSLALRNLLFNGDYTEAMTLAKRTISDNDDRKRIVKDAARMVSVDDFADKNIIIVKLNNICEGVIGLIAADLCQKSGKPSIVFTDTVNGLKGSARGIEGDNIFESVSSAGELLEKFGGHAGAAGITVLPENYDKFKERMEMIYATKSFHEGSYYDFAIRPDDADKVLQVLEKLEPLGKGNESPVVVIKSVEKEASVIGAGDTIKIPLSGVDIIGFHMASDYGKVKDRKNDFFGRLVYNEYRGRKTPQLVVQGIA